MLKIAIPNKGNLSEKTVKLFEEAGYRCRRVGRELVVEDSENDIEFFFLRPRDIAVYVGRGLLDLGVTGRDLAMDSQTDTVEVLPLNFGKSVFRYAVPKDSDLVPGKFGGLRIATSYSKLVKDHLDSIGVEAQVVRLDGAVEISIQLGVADAIADVVETGSTLVQAGLKIVGDPVMSSEAIVVGRDDAIREHPAVVILVERLMGIIVAREYAMIEYDIPKDRIDQVSELTPGIESPTLAPLSKPDWVAVKSMIKHKDANRIMDSLKALGATGIIVTDIRSCRI